MTATGPKPLLVIFAKAPVLGTVKTRLAQSIGAPAALAFHRECLAGTVARLAPSGRWRTALAVTPDESAKAPNLWPTGPDIATQGPGDLGDRMGRFLDRAQGAAPVIIVGSDIPEIAERHVASAVDALMTHELVVGAARDGGYWLIGAGVPPATALFAGVRWSSAHALADTLANARHLRVARLPDVLEDVDDLASYRRFRARGA